MLKNKISKISILVPILVPILDDHYYCAESSQGVQIEAFLPLDLINAFWVA